MGYIYAYAPDENDCSTVGLVGALLPTECEFSLEAGSYGELTLKHPKDDLGKWKALQTSVILKASVPVRLCPEIRRDGTYITTVETWSVSSTATSSERALYKTADKDKKTTTLPAGQIVTVLETSFNRERTRVKATVVTVKRKKTYRKNYSGWIKTSILENKISERTIPANSAGAEEANASYAVREQLFRIYDTTVSDGSNGMIEVKARRIVYDLLGNLCTYVNTGAEITGLAACQGILANTVTPHDFSVYSDVADTRSALDCRDLNPIEALIANETGMVARWNAETVSDDYDIYVLHRAGMDRGVSIAYGKNLTGITCEVDTSEVALGIRPRGEKKDGTPLYLSGTETLPDGYSFGTDDHDKDVIYSDLSKFTEVIPKVAPLTVSDAKISDDVKEDLAKKRMIKQAIAQFEDACDVAKITMKVEFIMLGDTDEYKQYRHLEPLFVYDTVHISHKPLGISAAISLLSLKWDCIAERMTEATFGSLEDISASVASWQISSISGGKIVPGTVSSVALQDDIISARHVQADSINTDALQARSITTDKLAAEAVTADKIKANTITAGQIDANSVSSAVMQTDGFRANVADIVQASVADLSVDFAQVKISDTETGAVNGLIVRDTMNAKSVNIERLALKNGQIESAVISDLVLKVHDEDTIRYVRLEYNSALGTLVPVELNVGEDITADEIAAGYTESGSFIQEYSGAFSELSAESFSATLAVINRIKADQIDALHLTARAAYIDALTAITLRGAHGTLGVIAGNAETDSATLKKYFTFDENGLRIKAYTTDESGNETLSPWSTLTDETGYHIDNMEKSGHVASFEKDRLTVPAMDVGGRIIVKKSSSGGMKWIVATRED